MLRHHTRFRRVKSSRPATSNWSRGPAPIQSMVPPRGQPIFSVVRCCFRSVRGNLFSTATSPRPALAQGLPARFPMACARVALRSDEIVGVAGFLVPGSHLDVLVTYRSDHSPEPVTATVLQDAVVIAAGQQAEPDPSGKPSAVTVVTLLLTPEESERAVLASTQGAIHFVLRNGDDASRTHDAPMLLSQLSGDAPAPGPTVRHSIATAPVVPVHHEIETILGDGGSKQ